MSSFRLHAIAFEHNALDFKFKVQYSRKDTSITEEYSHIQAICLSVWVCSAVKSMVYFHEVVLVWDSFGLE